MGRIRYGTSGWSYRDWVGNVYPPGTPSTKFLAHYARVHDCVEVPGTYYAIPSERMVAGWNAHTPEGFTFLPKMTRSIVHAGEGANPDGKRLLNLEHVRGDLELFLDRVSALGSRLGPILVQLPYLNRKTMPGFDAFMERIVPFLDALPADLSFALEIRNKAFIQPALLAELRRRRIAYGLADQEWMPLPRTQLESHDLDTAPFGYLRLIGERERTEKLVADRPEGHRWTGVVLERDADLDDWVHILRTIEGWTVDVTYVICNNHYQGHGPTTARLLAERMAGPPPPPPARDDDLVPF